MKRISYLVVLSFIFIFYFGVQSYAVEVKKPTAVSVKAPIINSTTVSFPDENFEKAIRKAINKPKGIIYKKDLLKITWLNLGMGGIKSVKGIRYLPNLEYISLDRNQVADVTEFVYLRKLKEVNLNSNKIKDINPLSMVTTLETIYAFDNQITNINSFSSLKNLKTLGIHNNPIKDLSPLKNLKNMKSLYFSNTGVKDLSFLNSLTNIEDLVFAQNAISNISPLKNLTNLKSLICSGNRITDASPISDLQKLESLELLPNPILDFDCLEKLDSRLKVKTFDIKKQKELVTKVKQIVKENVNSSMTELEKEKALYVYVIKHVEYSDAEPDCGTAYSSLIKGTGVCSAYSGAMCYLLNAAGIEAYDVGGFVNGGGHGWNIVKINGKYYHIDATFDDHIDWTSFTFFNLSDKKMLEQKRVWNINVYPRCD